MTKRTSFAESGVLARLDEFRPLRDGWLAGRGRAPSHAGLDWLSNAFDHRYPDDLSPPYVYPTAEGGIQAEWTFGPWEITLEVDLDNHDGSWHALNLETDEQRTREIDLDDAKAWDWIANAIRRLCEER